MNELLEQICELVSIDETELALNDLVLIFNSFRKINPINFKDIQSLRTELILVNSQFKRLTKQVDKNRITIKEFNVELNKINNSILSIVSEFEMYPDLDEFTEMISSKMEIKESLQEDDNSNNISDVLERLVSSLGFNHFELLEKITKGRSYKEDYIEIHYPFLTQINLEDEIQFDKELKEISLLAKNVFSAADSLVTDNELSEWIKASPKSWLVYKEEGKIKGFIHIEILSKSMSEKIINGLSHEGEIKGKDILDDKDACKEDYIHIGSIISSMDVDFKERYSTSIHLLYGLTERIIDINLQTDIKKLFSVSFPDKNGNRNANSLLRKIGFQPNGKKTLEGDEIYIMDIEIDRNQYINDLFEKVDEYRYGE